MFALVAFLHESEFETFQREKVSYIDLVNSYNSL
jgi:hypothetical protein